MANNGTNMGAIKEGLWDLVLKVRPHAHYIPTHLGYRTITRNDIAQMTPNEVSHWTAKYKEFARALREEVEIEIVGFGKKPKVKKTLTDWNKHVKKIHAQHPHLEFKKMMELASKTY